MLIHLYLCDHRVAEAKGLEETFENSIIFVFFVVDVLVILCILKIDIGDARGILDGRWVFAAILIKARREPFELHNVLGQCACFVTENVVYHAQFFVQVGRLDRSLKASTLVAHFGINRYKVCLSKVDHFKCDKKRDRNEVH
jgi:hypothetical protein